MKDIFIEGSEQHGTYLCIYEGYQVQPNVHVVPSIAKTTMSSTDDSILEVLSNGMLKALSAGYADWIISAGNQSVTWPVKVYSRESMESFLSYQEENGAYVSDDRNCKPGESFQLEVNPDSDLAFADNSIIWSSSDESVAVVDKNGWVECIGEGISTISAQKGWGCKDEITLIVRNEVSAVVFEQSLYEAKAGDWLVIEATLEGCDQNLYRQLYKDVAWHDVHWDLDGFQEIDPVWDEERQLWIYSIRYKIPTGYVGIAAIKARAMDGSYTENTCAIIVHSDNQLQLPADLKDIGSESFAQVSSEEIILTEGVQTIGARTFADCKNLKIIYIPKTVTSIAPDAFDGSPKLEILCKKGSYAEDYAKENNITHVAIESCSK